MKITHLNLVDFMIFDSIDVEWSNGINVILGENSTGKTTLLKALYSLVKPYGRIGFAGSTKNQQKEQIENKIVGVFRPDEKKIGQLARRSVNSKKNSDIKVSDSDLLSHIKVTTDGGACILVSFSNRNKSHANIDIFPSPTNEASNIVYLPPKEMISSTEHFQSLYEDYQIDFEEMYYDLTKLLDRPLLKANDPIMENRIISIIEEDIHGKVVHINKKFYLKTVDGLFEMGLVSEGYKKLATIAHLMQSGSLGKGSILFWDEPETNMNPKMIEPIAQVLAELSLTGVQVFITTHDYFTMQSLNLIAKYQSQKPIDIQFYSLYHNDDKKVMLESSSDVNDLTHNAIMEEFDNLYNREQDMLYGDIN